MLSHTPDITPTYIFNPLKEDFTTTYAQDKTPVKYTIPSRELMIFPRWLADHIGNKIARTIALNKSPSISWDIRLEEARKEVFVTV